MHSCFESVIVSLYYILLLEETLVQVQALGQGSQVPACLTSRPGEDSFRHVSQRLKEALSWWGGGGH